MTKSEIRDIVITGSYLINNGMKEPTHGWEDYANKLEDMLVKNNGVLRIVSNNEALASNEGVAVCAHEFLPLKAIVKKCYKCNQLSILIL